MKKSQIEVMGLLVIVILFILILFFFATFLTGNESERELRGSLESSNFLRAMMFYTPRTLTGVSCGKQIREIAEECRVGKVECGKDCKVLLYEEIGNILNVLDESLDREYSFVLNAPDYNYARDFGDCAVGIVDSYKTRNLEARIRIC